MTSPHRSELLRFFTCGSVDDGKSTLIGRLLYDTKLIFEDQMEALQRSADLTGGGQVNLANLTDGLRAEREQGITIDVAYRYFATPRRKFIVADTPGHVQYTRNMVTGASTANLAIILVDARQGVLQQTRRHAFIASLLRIPHLVVCVNKMDLVGWSQETFDRIRSGFAAFTGDLVFQEVTFIPVSALNGDNVVERSAHTPWYPGPTLLGHLEEVYIAGDRDLVDARFPVQYVVRPQSDEFHDFRGLAGQVAGGEFRVGDAVMVLPSGLQSRIGRIHTYDGDLESASAGQSVTILLEDDIDISRGDLLIKPDRPPLIGTDLEAMVCWMSDQPLKTGIKYALKHTTCSTRAMIRTVQHRVDIDTLQQVTGVPTLGLNEIGRISLKTLRPLAYDPYERNRLTGGFILVDEATNNTVAAGLLLEPPRPVPAAATEGYVI
jgi:sulfate adenylyltransferase large subunit